jgi:hypothetical protein
MTTYDWFKACGLLSVLLTWSAIAFVIYRAPRDLSKSISHHAALQKREYRVFAVTMTLALCLMYVFIMRWLVPALSLNTYISAALLVALAMELLTTWVPLTDGITYTAHNYLSYGTALLIPLALTGIVVTSTLSSTAALVVYIALAVMFILMLVFLTIKKAHERYLVYQSIYIAAFHIAIISIALLS